MFIFFSLPLQVRMDGWIMTDESIVSGWSSEVNQTTAFDDDGQLAVVTLFDGSGVRVNSNDLMAGGDGDELAVTAAGYGFLEMVLISGALLIIIVGTIVGNILVCTAVCLVRRL